MSKLSFRARALDASKPLPVFRCEDLPDLHEYVSINRAVPQMPTGMEKEEESEHHLQRAISAQQVYGEKKDSMVIPVPAAESNITYYERLYPGDFKMPKQLIHIQPFSLDTEQPDYDLDSEDEVFVTRLRKKMEVGALQFEEMLDRLEKGSGQQLVTLQGAKLLLKQDDELIMEVFEYWSKKRKSCQSGSLIPSVKQEKRDGSSTNDPYVAFRRRTEKMQTRKNRKNDEVSYEKMLKLRRDLSRAVTILEMIKRREKSKRELLHLTLEIVEKRNCMADFGGEVLAEVLAQQALEKTIIPLIPITTSSQYRHTEHDSDYKNKVDKQEVVRQKKKHEKKPKTMLLSGHPIPASVSNKALNQYDFPSSEEEPSSQLFSGSSEAEEENEPDGVFAFRRRSGCHYQSVCGEQDSWPWSDPVEAGLGDARYRYSLTTLTLPHRCVGLARRRVGRGGRILLDRAYCDWDAVYHELDLGCPISSFIHQSVSTSCHTIIRTSASVPSFSYSSTYSSDLSQVLHNIKTCRWRHFKPWTALTHDLSNLRSCSAQKLSFGRYGPARNQANIRPAVPPATPVFTAEQYHDHQEQLALMKREQLEQVQQQHRVNARTPTLDSLTAQFAASALVTSEQLMAMKCKEEGILGVGINGVISASGFCKGLHHTRTTSNSPIPTSNNRQCNSPISGSNNGTSSSNHHVGSVSSVPAQVLLAGAMKVGVPSPGAALSVRHLHRQLTVPSSALKLAANVSRQLPKVTTGSTSLDMGTRISSFLHHTKAYGENHDQEKSTLNNITENTVAMEVT
ncbi:enhancer of polycomb homolog 1b isoform X2 [Tachysurus vachellii]|uniref:enhancer of polycomb homolog 1b isoform X2 n=1 Tax=Tachysurus vachellii TaxID=175792 RepID=UPI00296B0CA6|nr:enhancer of polycomb homolog 1b isoform X2 [Tachysurus vachellii]